MAFKLITGLEDDCLRLVTRFEARNSPRFESFCEVWKEMHFSLVYAALTPREAIMFTFEALSFVKGFFVNTQSFLKKVCGIYMLYGLYYKQPVRNVGKILITLDDWTHLKGFIEILKYHHHDDTLYIVLKLIFDHAIEFSIAPNRRFNLLPIKYYNSDFTEATPSVDRLNIDQLIQHLSQVEKQYEIAKEKYSMSEGILNVNYANRNFSEALKDFVNSECVISDDAANATAPIVCMEEYMKRKSLRDKGYSSKAQTNLFKSIVFNRTNENDKDDDDDNDDDE